jgi:hypothetical protein
MKGNVLRFIGLVVLVAEVAFCQDNASLTGTVRDPQGALVAGATLAITNTATGIVRELKTNSASEYLAAALPPGQYDITINASGCNSRQKDFNIFNHTQWSGLNTGVGADNFMRATSTHLARVLQFGLKLSF